MIEFEKRGNVAILTLNRPEARNAVNGELARGLEAAVDRLENDGELWVGVLTGAGPVFCAGADLKAIAAGDALGLQTERGGFAGFVALPRTKPILAAVDGPALAGGTEICLACEGIVASTRASFGLPEVKRSLVAAAGALFRLPRALPRNLAYELVMTGDPISAEVAHRHGLVNVLCEPGKALDEALALAQRIAANAPLAVRESLRVMKESAQTDDATGFRLSNQAMGRLAATADFREGPRAFIEKRPPKWTGT